MQLRRPNIKRIIEIVPEDIFIDSSNLPDHETSRFEGKFEKPVARRALFAVGFLFVLVTLGFSFRAYTLQIKRGGALALTSANNILTRSLLFATRGVIYDRTGRELAWNLPAATSTPDGTPIDESASYPLRKYSELPGLSLLLGFVRYPKNDARGVWWRDSYVGMSGSELSFNAQLAGTNGSSLKEIDARGKVERQDVVIPPRDGENIHLSIDAEVQSKLYDILSQHAHEMGFVGGAGVIMDVNTGELIALTSFPEYSNQRFTDGDQVAIKDASESLGKPLLDRSIGGLYAPGSIMKPMFAAGALNEHIISPEKQILSTGAITIPNAYDPTKPTKFRDWTVHGWIDMRTALAVSSDEYFYTIGGGYGGQEGLGIDRLDKYSRLFGFGTTTGIDLQGEKSGVIPTIAWKSKIFPDDPWHLGDTYHSAIGQYGYQVTPIQEVRYISAIANGGTLFTPQVIASSSGVSIKVPIPSTDLQIVREGMRMAVTSDRTDATVKFLNLKGLELAAKTGTAQIGAHNEWVNSWSVGFWPASHPRYAYAVVLERGKAGTISGAAPGLVPFFQWLLEKHPEYIGAASSTAVLSTIVK